MEIGPVEYFVLAFPGNQFRGEIAPALREVVDKGIIRIIDIVFLAKDAGGNVTAQELIELDDDTARIFRPVVEDVTGLLTKDDIRHVSGLIAADSSAALVLFEHIWATKLREAVASADGRLVDGGLIPNEAVVTMIAAQATAAA
jgi:hypothetical protein